MENTENNTDFKFHVPVEFTKSTNDKGETQMRLKGVASTAHRDREGEVLKPEGFDISYLKKSGYINWHHQLAKNPEAIIGEPTSAKIDKGGLYLEGMLYSDSDLAQKAYRLANVLEKNSKTRRLGWSVEGKVMERDKSDPKKVTKAKITGVALTPMPINSNTYVSVVKAFQGGDGIMKAEEEYEMDFLEVVQKAMDDETPVKEEAHEASGGKTVLITLPTGGTLKVDKGGNVSINLDKANKAMTTTSAAAVIPESLEGDVKNTAFTEKKKLKKSELYEKLFTENPHISVDDAKHIVAKLQENHVV